MVERTAEVAQGTVCPVVLVDDLHFLVIGYQEHPEMQAAGDRKRIFLYNGGYGEYGKE